MTKRSWVVMAMLLLLRNISFSQLPKPVTGKLLDRQTGQPVAFAQLRLHNSSLQALSDSAGNFSMRIHTADILAVHHIAYKTQSIAVNPASASPLTLYLLSLSDDLGEITVSTGYQSILKERATGSADLQGTGLVLFKTNFAKKPKNPV